MSGWDKSILIILGYTYLYFALCLLAVSAVIVTISYSINYFVNYERINKIRYRKRDLAEYEKHLKLLLGVGFRAKYGELPVPNVWTENGKNTNSDMIWSQPNYIYGANIKENELALFCLPMFMKIDEKTYYAIKQKYGFQKCVVLSQRTVLIIYESAGNDIARHFKDLFNILPNKIIL